MGRRNPLLRIAFLAQDLSLCPNLAGQVISVEDAPPLLDSRVLLDRVPVVRLAGVRNENRIVCPRPRTSCSFPRGLGLSWAGT